MKRWRVVVALVLVLIPLTAFGMCHASARRVRQREANYEAVLRSYSAVLAPGMTRQTVEAYLRANDRDFLHICCVGMRHNAFDTLTKIGEEPPPWYCSELNVYITFTFVSGESHENAEAHDSDTLTSVSIFKWLTGCL